MTTRSRLGHGLTGVLLAGLLVSARSSTSEEPDAASSRDGTGPTSMRSTEPHHPTTTETPRTMMTPSRADLDLVARRFIDLARGTVDSGLDSPLPADTPVGLFLGNAHRHDIPAGAIGVRRRWAMCAPGYAQCPTSPLDAIAATVSPPAITYRLPGKCLAILADDPVDIGGSHLVVIRPAAPTPCRHDFAVELWTNDLGQVTAVNLLLGT